MTLHSRRCFVQRNGRTKFAHNLDACKNARVFHSLNPAEVMFVVSQTSLLRACRADYNQH